MVPFGLMASGPGYLARNFPVRAPPIAGRSTTIAPGDDAGPFALARPFLACPEGR
jgi:hypothetical protein